MSERTPDREERARHRRVLDDAAVAASAAITTYFEIHGYPQSAGEDTHLATYLVAALRRAGFRVEKDANPRPGEGLNEYVDRVAPDANATEQEIRDAVERWLMWPPLSRGAAIRRWFSRV